MKKGFYYIYIVAKNTVEQKKKVIFQMVNHIIFLLVSLFLYKHVYELVPSMKDKLPFPNTVWSMSVYFIIFWLGLRNIERNLRKDIRTGNIEIYLLRPIGYIWQKVFVQIGTGLIAFLSATILSVLVDYFLVGLPVLNSSILYWVFCIFVVFILSQILTCFIFVLCGLSAFWLENSEPIYFVVSKLIMIFGGAWVPIAFFPKLFQLFAEYSPFGASMSVSFIMYPDFAERFPFIILNLIFWILFSYILTIIVSKRAFKKLAVNG
ncbi:MAG: ABC-2 family transporter protein [Candidatus Nomurabacteria bacterium]|nr:ABC-2 family transporter protein [Candidatus Nomurabacteria bacterium]